MTEFAAVRKAFLVASYDYEDARLTKLRAPAQDVADLEAVLATADIGGFAVDKSINEPHWVLQRRIFEFFRDARRDEQLLVHVSCHGLKDDFGNLYFATADTYVDLLGATAVPADWLNEQMTRSRSRSILLLLDCCYSGAFASGMQAKGDDSVQLAERFQGTGRFVLTASDSMEYAFVGEDLTGEGLPSVFTSAVVQGLATGEADRDADNKISVGELYDYVSDLVAQKTPKQTPCLWTFGQQGTFFVARSRTSASRLPEQIVTAAKSPLQWMREAAVADLAPYLGSDDEATVQEARRLLERLAADDVPRVADAAKKVLRGTPMRPWDDVSRRTVVLASSGLGAVVLALVLWLVFGSGSTPPPPGPAITWALSPGTPFGGPGHQEVVALAPTGYGQAIAVGYAAPAKRQHRPLVWLYDGAVWSADLRMPSDAYGRLGAVAAQGIVVVAGGTSGRGIDRRDAAVWRAVGNGAWQRVCLGASVDTCNSYRSEVAGLVGWRGGFVAVGRAAAPGSTDPHPTAWRSADGLEWTRTFAGGSSGVMRWVTRAGGRLIAVGSVGPKAAVWLSSDGSSWRPVGSDGNGDLADAESLTGVAVRGSTAVAVGFKGGKDDSCDGDTRSEAVAFRSTDGGRTWAAQSSSAFHLGQRMVDVVAFAGGFVALGYDHLGCSSGEDRVGAAWTSKDGTEWAEQFVPRRRYGSELNRGTVVGAQLFAGGDGGGGPASPAPNAPDDEHDAEIWEGTAANPGATVAR